LAITDVAPGKWLPRPSRAKSVVAKYPDLFIICLSTSVQNLVLLSQNAQRVSYAAPLGVLPIKSCFAECTAADNYKNVPRNAMCRSKSCPLLHNSVGTSVGFVAAAVSMSTGGCRARRPAVDVSVVSAETVDIIVAAELAVL